ncbi:(2Fe-2S) ferredoxin domain-containing protein [Aquipseudomonas ullengensis]|uniref:(2Fe-2S) ferredoxin domain-containing protein n=1 Tax=Aquipseudomonas ullengensis TaxID=2759166 RepID=A0A7W4LN87_9GAMM|nr:(2Fe-2S) ferredoxin domain-containing protein [Pseudomonas ullengensis]MBB2496284.1 (2Fe-2S) ferredoxin domain-containing protein [Pseudomonas ullengensis]
MTTTAYARILFVGPDLLHGSFAELFQRQLKELRGPAALADVVGTDASFAPLWQRVSSSLEAGELPLLLVDLDPQSSSQSIDWLRSELQQLAAPFAASAQVFVNSSASLPGLSPAETACALIERRELHLDCQHVAPLPSAHAWSCIPTHQHRVLLCNGPRCTRRGALPLWKSLREQLKTAGKLECEGGVHITRTQCQFPCDQGPTLSLYPAGIWYQIRDEADVQRLVQEQFVEGREVPELIMRRD